MNIPVLTYHSNNVTDNSYAGNDHVALEADLKRISELDVEIISLEEVYGWHQGQALNTRGRGCVALTFDDGSDFDYFDLPHPKLGLQRSFLNILRAHNERTRMRVCASIFVISSPDARKFLDQRCLIGKGWWNDHWWPAAEASGLMSIECHSWDHVHPCLERVAQAQNLKGDFSAISSWGDCDQQVRRAADYIESRLAGRRPRFFAYPWGQSSTYLKETYMPGETGRHRFLAAFTTEPSPVTRSHSRWDLPRFICGRDWRSVDELAALLGQCL